MGSPSQNKVIREVQLTGLSKSGKEPADQGRPEAERIGERVEERREGGEDSVGEDQHSGTEEVDEVERGGAETHSDGRSGEHPGDIHGLEQVVVWNRLDNQQDSEKYKSFAVSQTS